ncbi:MAG: murein biosynthesis integral membrane protein MurJ [Micropepsaceae bacterium]
MYRALLSTSGFTLISRVTGFVRDMIMSRVLGDGMLSDAFIVAFRLPNHFRTIFAEGAYNAAFVPMYAGLKTKSAKGADDFSRNMLGWQVAIQIVLLLTALLVMPWVVAFLAPGFVGHKEQMDLATSLTRITFGYLLCVTIVTHLGGVLNAEGKFWAAAAAPVLLNISMAISLLLAFIYPSAGYAAAVGVLTGGVAELLLLLVAAWSSGISIVPTMPRLSDDVRLFFVRFGPATLGAAGVQVAMFADTIFASFLGQGAYTSLYYADRINQLPMGVIAIALGTVLLPEVTKSITKGDAASTARSFNRATEIGLLLTLPCTAAFFVIPDSIMTALFAGGAFNVKSAVASGEVLLMYAVGLPAFVMLRTVTPLFHARGDTQAPVIATGIAIAVNLALKAGLVLGLSMGVQGLALATALGTWVNLGVLAFIGARREFFHLDQQMLSGMLKMLAAAVFAGLIAWLVTVPLNEAFDWVGRYKAIVCLFFLGVAGLGSYAVGLLALGWQQR